MIASKGRINTYEAMFLVGQAASTDMKAVIEHLNHLFERAGATVIAMTKWDERRLAFEIEKQKRGTYILAFFSCDPSKLPGFERDCNLSETILRTLTLRADHLTIEEMQAFEGRRDMETEANLRNGPAGGPSGAPSMSPRNQDAEAVGIDA